MANLCTEVPPLGTGALDEATIVADNTPTPPGLGVCQGIPMGLGALGNGSIQFKRKFRWTFEIAYCCGNGDFAVPREFVKLGNRPQIAFDEVEINYLNGVTWIPGKGKWQTITMTFYDVAGPATLSPPRRLGRSSLPAGTTLSSRAASAS